MRHFILITHDLSILAETCDKIAVMYAGRIVEKGSSEDIFQRTGHPYTKKLIKCFPDIKGKKTMMEGIPGAPPNMLEIPSGCPFHPRCEYAEEVCRTSMPDNIERHQGHFVACHKWEVIRSER